MRELKPNVEDNYDNPTNMNNYPSHKVVDEDGKEHSYAAYSKVWSRIDPEIDDPHHYHTHSAHTIYLLFKNKHTGVWEFPTMPMH